MQCECRKLSGGRCKHAIFSYASESASWFCGLCTDDYCSCRCPGCREGAPEEPYGKGKAILMIRPTGFPSANSGRSEGWYPNVPEVDALEHVIKDQSSVDRGTSSPEQKEDENSFVSLQEVEKRCPTQHKRSKLRGQVKLARSGARVPPTSTEGGGLHGLLSPLTPREAVSIPRFPGQVSRWMPGSRATVLWAVLVTEVARPLFMSWKKQAERLKGLYGESSQEGLSRRRNVKDDWTSRSRTDRGPSGAPVAGDRLEASDESGASPEDIELVMTQVPCSRSTAVASLEANNFGRTQKDIVEAIMHIATAAIMHVATAAVASSDSQQHAGLLHPVLDFRDDCRDPALQEGKSIVHTIHDGVHARSVLVMPTMKVEPRERLMCLLDGTYNREYRKRGMVDLGSSAGPASSSLDSRCRASRPNDSRARSIFDRSTISAASGSRSVSICTRMCRQ